MYIPVNYKTAAKRLMNGENIHFLYKSGTSAFIIRKPNDWVSLADMESYVISSRSYFAKHYGTEHRAYIEI